MVTSNFCMSIRQSTTCTYHLFRKMALSTVVDNHVYSPSGLLIADINYITDLTIPYMHLSTQKFYGFCLC